MLLAECYIADGKPYKVAHILRDCSHSHGQYLLALAFTKIGALDDAELVLRSSIKELSKGAAVAGVHPGPQIANGAYGLFLMGQIMEKKGKTDEAIAIYNEAWKRNNTLWSALARISFLRDKTDHLSEFIGEAPIVERD